MLEISAYRKRILEFRWRYFFKEIYGKAGNPDILSRSAQVAFYFAFSLFPMLFFLISLFALILDSTVKLQQELFAYLGQIMPAAAYELVERTVAEVISSSTPGKVTFGLFATLWSASAGIDSLRNALNAIYGLKERRKWWKRKLQSVAITLLFIILTAFVLLTVFYGWRIFQTAFAAVGLGSTPDILLIAVQWTTILFVMLFAFDVLYNLLPYQKERVWWWISPGALAAIALWLLLTRAFAVYLAYFSSYDKTYGSLGAVMILLLWLYLTALVLIIGGAINSVYFSVIGEQAEPSEKPDEAEDPVPEP